MVIRSISVFVLAVNVAGFARAGNMPCAGADEKTAFDVRALQSDLMVAALTCNMRNEYNAFVTAYADVLPDFGEDLRGYFSRVYRQTATTKLDGFVTDMAGGASLRSLDVDPNVYCADIKNIYRALKKDDVYPEDVAAVYADRHPVSFCTAYPQGEIYSLFANLLF